MPHEQQPSKLDQGQTAPATGSPRWLTFAMAGATAVGVMWAAAFATQGEIDPQVGTTAWIAAAIIGSSAVISAGAAERRSAPPPRPEKST